MLRLSRGISLHLFFYLWLPSTSNDIAHIRSGGCQQVASGLATGAKNCRTYSMGMLDACNAVLARDGNIANEVEQNGIGTTSQKYLAGARIVRAFNTMSYMSAIGGKADIRCRLSGSRPFGASARYVNFTTFVSVCSQVGHSKVRRS